MHETSRHEILDLVRSLELRVPGRKLKKIRQEATKVHNQEPPPTTREVSRLLGKLSSVSQAIPPGPLFCRAIQRDLASALERDSQSYNGPCPLSLAAKEELSWWGDQLTKWNGKSLVLRNPDLQIESDASRIGWGAFCEEVHTGGPWSLEETDYHINCLELLAATLAVKTFLKDQVNKRILLLIDNRTAVAYINNLGGTVSAQATILARNLWMWCLERGILITAQYIPGEENIRADTESRVMRDRSDWMLNPTLFQRIQRRFPNLEIDLFASRLSSQLPRFFSWRPDPLAEATDAFLQDWRGLRAYANPPWNLTGRVLSKVEEQAMDLVLIAPVWPSQPWYPKLLSLLVSNPLRINHQEMVMTEVWGGNLPEITPPLAVWPISGNNMQTREFQERLLNSSSHRGEKNQLSHTIPFARGGSAGALNGISIPFQDL